MAVILIASADALDVVNTLGEDGHDCVLCTDGDAVCTALARARPDLVVADADLPGQDGFDLVAQVSGMGIPLMIGQGGEAFMGFCARAEDLQAMVRARLIAVEGGTRVLVIEDDFELRTLLVRRLKMAGYEVATAQDGEEGLARLIDQPDLVLTDVHMPLLDGFGFLERMRADARYQDVPVIVMTALSGRAEDVARGFDLGANDYVRKPIEWRELLARVETHLRVRDGYRLAAEKQRDLAMIELAGAAAHEINNPLSVAMARLELMKEGMDVAHHEHIAQLSGLMSRIADIVKKLSQVRRYQVRHYCGGVNIVDLDGASEDG